MIKLNKLHSYLVAVGVLASSPPLAAAPTLAAPALADLAQAAGQDSCGAQDPRSLWECWRGGQGTRERPWASPCTAKTACPPVDPGGKPVQGCKYESSWRTGFRCILFCDYGGAAPWGSDGGTHCD